MQRKIDNNIAYMLGFDDGRRNGVKIKEKELIEANTNLSDENRLLKQGIEELEDIRRKAMEYIEKYSDYNVIPYRIYEILKGGKNE